MKSDDRNSGVDPGGELRGCNPPPLWEVYELAWLLVSIAYTVFFSKRKLISWNEA